MNSSKFGYILLMATNAFKHGLFNIFVAGAALAGITTTVIINGEDCEAVRQQYLDAAPPENARFLATPNKGKSLELNTYICELEDPDTFLIFNAGDFKIGAQVFRHTLKPSSSTATSTAEAVPTLDASLKSQKPACHCIELMTRNFFLGCNSGAFAADIRAANYFGLYLWSDTSQGQWGRSRRRCADWAAKRFSRGYAAVSLPPQF